MKKRLLSALLACAMACSLCVPAMAADLDYATRVADAMYEAGLFGGTGVDANGKPIYELERTAARSEGVTMLVRVLGKAGEAQANVANYQTPFTDVPDWAKAYVGYAYENKLTNGVSANAFGSNLTVSATQYLTFILIALGYESGVDFTWNTSYELAEELGIIEKGEWRANETFTRGDMVVISYKALMSNKKDSNKTLAESLGVNDLPEIAPESSEYTPNDDVFARFTYVNAEDPNNLVLDNLGNMSYDIYSASEGTVIRHSDLTFVGSANENVQNFFAVMNQLDVDVQADKDGYVTYAGSECGSYVVKGNNYILTKDSWGGWSTGTKTGRNIFLNALVYFGGEDMGTAVYGMLDEHYRFRSDGSVPISNELAAKYGLTINHTENKGHSYTATVSNGMDTWTIRYCTENPYGAQNTIIKIPT